MEFWINTANFPRNVKSFSYNELAALFYPIPSSKISLTIFFISLLCVLPNRYVKDFV